LSHQAVKTSKNRAKLSHFLDIFAFSCPNFGPSPWGFWLAFGENSGTFGWVLASFVPKSTTNYPIFAAFLRSKMGFSRFFSVIKPVAIDGGHSQCESKMPVEKSAGMYVIYSFYYIYLFSI
jgi:hypothetical protein